MTILNGERFYSENEILDIAERHMNEIALNNLLKSGLFGDIAVGITICMTHVIADLKLNSKRADRISERLQAQVVEEKQKKAA